ncbi:LacI family DNA-binding transcriptional regulator [Parabacteroides pacaensis]|uniref:LacI family DNA-binding transcriptional regulator n=1 Tax=Parabacteroides pacaensis TaxID=2086575 RepID=UPI000D0E5C1C|nr:LacI family DNA-binding transcriptional regulator [Parabacteroides pacaensis]
MRTSLKDIAEKLNLSKATISWTLSGKGDEKGISMATQEKVFQCAKELNYQPNLLARSLHSGYSKTIGLIIPDITDSFYSKIACVIEKEADARGYSVMIGNSESRIDKENKLIHLLKAKQVDGIILAPTKVSKSEIQTLVDESFPLVLFDRYFPQINTNYVIIDNEESSYQLVHKMIRNGARKIAIITTNSYLRTMNMRREGYARALMEMDLPVEPELYGEVPFVDYEHGIDKILDRIFAEVPDVDAFFFTTHILAIEAFRYFYDKGIDVKKYELACIHSISSFRALAPNINIAFMPIDEIGENTVRILLKSIEHRQKNPRETQKVESVLLHCTISTP